jgi:hypothetical protein
LLLNFSDRDAELFSVSAGSKDFRLFAKRPTIVATVDHADLPLHVQNPPVPKLSWELADEVVRIAAPPGEERLWQELSAFYRDSAAATKLWRERNAAKDAKPHHGSSLLDGDIDELLKSGFAVEVGDISSLPAHLHVNCIVFTVVEEHKHRRRVIAWPRATNFREREILDLLRSQHAIVPFSRISNLRKRVQKRFAAQLDLTKFFQQFTLHTSDNFLFAHDGKAYRLSTIPTGAVSPPILAQVLLRAVLALAIRQTATTEHVVFDTMIDNARLCSDDFAALQLAWDRAGNLQQTRYYRRRPLAAYCRHGSLRLPRNPVRPRRQNDGVVPEDCDEDPACSAMPRICKIGDTSLRDRLCVHDGYLGVGCPSP